MVTTRSKTSRLAGEPVDLDSSFNKSISSKSEKASKGANWAQAILFISVTLDLLAFTVILPLFPSILLYYKKNDGPTGLYSYIETKIQHFQRAVGAPASSNLVLFGGFLGSLFSFLQFLASPIIGAISDVYGRKPVLILCLFGLALSYWLWSVSSTFFMFVIARIIGGVSKGNLHVSMAAMTDISSTEKRASGMAMIGIAFSVGFVIGPLIGAYFSRASTLSDFTSMWFVKPAYFSLSLVMADILFIIALLKETLPKEKRMKSVASSLRQAIAYINVRDIFMFTAMKNIKLRDLKQLRMLGFIYFLHLFLYSGLEFTLTFLVHHKFHYTSLQQGYMYCGIGITMALLQGLWIRRISPESVQNYSSLGLLLVVPAFLAIGFAQNDIVLNIGIFVFAVATSFVVPCMTTMASKYGSSSQKGTVLGILRSLGSLARAMGPIVASVAYYILGPVVTYSAGGLLLLIPWCLLKFSSSMKV